MMSSSENAPTMRPAATKKKRARTKRKVLKPQDNIKDVPDPYSVANIHNTFQASFMQQKDSDDEEEDILEFQAKLNKRISKTDICKKTKTSYVSISDEEDGHRTPEMVPSDSSFKIPSPSPPPPPPLEFREPKNKRLETAMRKLDNAYHNAVLKQRIEQSPLASPHSQVVDVDLDNSFDLARHRQEMTVKVRTRQGLKRYQLAMDEPLIKILISLAEQEDVDVNTIQLTKNAEQLNEGDTPASLNLRVSDILDCVVIDPSNVTHEDLSDLIPEEDKVLIKFQGQAKKSGFPFRIPNFEPLKPALVAYSQFIETPLEKLKFVFDGDEVSPSDTPKHLDMEEEATIDVIMR